MYSIPMAIVDFIPVIFFGIAAIILLKDLYSKMSPAAFTLFAAGSVDVFAAGFLKAVHKLLYAAGICDFERLYAMFFPVEAIGFMLSGLGLLLMFTRAKKKKTLLCVFPLPLVMGGMLAGSDLLGAPPVPPVYSGTVIFIVMMVVGVALQNICLARAAGRMKKPWAAVLFIVSLVFSLMMGYLGTKEFDQAYMEWAAELVNIIGQGSLLAAAVILDKAGLAEAEIV